MEPRLGLPSVFPVTDEWVVWIAALLVLDLSFPELHVLCCDEYGLFGDAVGGTWEQTIYWGEKRVFVLEKLLLDGKILLV